MHPQRAERGEIVTILGCGYVGRALAARLAHEPGVSRVIATTTTPGRVADLERLGLEPVLVTLGEGRGLGDAIGEARVVYFTAAPGSSGDYSAVYRDGTRQLLRAAEGTAVRRILYTSSTAVYVQDDGSWVDETAETAPTTERGRILLDAESTLLDGAAALGVSATVLRLAGIHGPGRGPQNVAARLAGTRRTDGESYLNLIHRDVVVEALLRLRATDHQGVLNLADGRPRTRRAYYDTLLARQGLPPVRWEPPVEGGPAGRGRRIDSRRIQELLGIDLVPSPQA